MKKAVIWLYIIIFIIIIPGNYLVTIINPTYRFSNRKLPVLATPSASQNQVNSNISSLPGRKKSFNILILGLDTWDNSYGRADLIMVVNINPKTKKINVISIPRDTKVSAGRIGWTKINHLHLLAENKETPGGTRGIMNTVSSLLQCTLKYYIKINFQGFENFIDRLGGLDIHLDHPVELTFKKITLASGKHHLDGETVLELVRERYSLKRGDFARQYHQFQVLKALTGQLLKPGNFIRLPALIQEARSNVVETNLGEADFISIAGFIRKLPEPNLKYHQIPGESQYGLDPLTHTKVYYWKPDLDSVKRIGRDYF